MASIVECPIPDPPWTNFQYLISLGMSVNALLGPIPDSIWALPNLRSIRLSSNQIEGFIPVNIGNSSSLAYIYLYGNRLSGTIPDSIGNLRDLVTIDISDNKLVGQIPASIGRLDELVNFIVSDNDLSGPIPATFEQNRRIINLSVSGNCLERTAGTKFNLESQRTGCPPGPTNTTGTATNGGSSNGNTTSSSSGGFNILYVVVPIIVLVVLGSAYGIFVTVRRRRLANMAGKEGEASQQGQNQMYPSSPPSASPVVDQIYQHPSSAATSSMFMQPPTQPQIQMQAQPQSQPQLTDVYTYPPAAPVPVMGSSYQQNSSPLVVAPMLLTQPSTSSTTVMGSTTSGSSSAVPLSFPSQSSNPQDLKKEFYTPPPTFTVFDSNALDSKHPFQWTPEDVKSWILSKGMSLNVAEGLYNEDIDGQALLTLTTQILTERLKLTYGLSVKLDAAIQDLRKRWNMVQLDNGHVALKASQMEVGHGVGVQEEMVPGYER
ncbi:hypothetical protein HDV05_004268 [Chytridiales sp. JEL 0842]|nr:hypothetical protein HDV05_004268 [Chytridiales sp. JEL 0842]